MTTFDIRLNATITPVVLEQMINHVVEEQTGRKVKKITFSTTLAYEDRPNGSQYPMFTGAEVIFEN